MAEHVLALGMEQSSDREIWEYAATHRAIIVTKDEDFMEWKRRIPGGTPLLWIRLGNCPNRILLESLLLILPTVIERFEQGEELIEVR